MYKYYDDECEIICAALDKIRKELDRCYWNKNQKEMSSPFDNTGEEYSNNIFSVYAYYWGDDELQLRPNFIYKDLKVFWYKHSNRGVYAESEHMLTLDDLNTMIIECNRAIRNDFERRK